ncbi:MAG: ROK family protein [Micrococcaceae bacterium]
MILALDIGGTKVASALVTLDGEIVKESVSIEKSGRDKNSEELFDACVRVMKAAKGDEDIIGIGVGSAAPLDLNRGVISPLNLPAWREFPIVKKVEEVFPGTPVRLASDGVCIALAEHWKGAGTDVENLLAMIVSTGVGGGLVIGGKPLSGTSGNAGHIGHIEVADFGLERCACGNFGCLEAVTSGPNTVKWAIKQGWRKGEDTSQLAGEDLAEDARNGDKIALRAFERSGTALGRAIASAMALLEFDLVVIGGGFANSGDLLLEPARKAIKRPEFKFIDVEIVPTGLDGYGPLIGAAALFGIKDLDFS